MKFTFSKPSLLAYTSFILLVGFSIPLVAQMPASIVSYYYVSMGHFQEESQKDSLAAVSSFTQAIRLNPKAEEPYYHRANAYAAIGNYQAAVADYSEVIKQNTGRVGFSSPAYWNRARAYEKLGEKHKAISDLNQSISSSSPYTYVEEYLLRGNLYKDLGNKESARADYKTAEKLLQEYLKGSYGSGFQDPRYQEMLENVRNELSKLNS